MGDVLQIQRFYVTFGVQYTKDPEHGEQHPLGVTGDNYVIIEAPDEGLARGIANAIFGEKYAFIYDEAHFIDDGSKDRWYARYDALAFSIAWVTPWLGGAA